MTETNTATMTSAPTIEQRLAALEVSARRWKVSAVGLAMAVVGVVSMGANEGDSVLETVKAKSIQAIDSQGRTVAVLTSTKRSATEPSERGVLILLDRDGKPDGSKTTFFYAGDDPVHRTTER